MRPRQRMPMTDPCRRDDMSVSDRHTHPSQAEARATHSGASPEHSDASAGSDAAERADRDRHWPERIDARAAALLVDSQWIGYLDRQPHERVSEWQTCRLAQ